MRSVRPALRYFNEADLRPPSGVAAPVVAGGGLATLLSPEQLADLKTFAAAYDKDGEALVSDDELAGKSHLKVFIAFCAAFGAVTVGHVNNAVRVRPAGRLGQHLPEILCVYIENLFSMFDDWNNVHVAPEDEIGAMAFLHQLEVRRIRQERLAGRMPRPLAHRPVAFAIFHAKNERGESCYLFEVNKDWRRLNFIGGKQEPRDRGDYLETIRREVGEELGIARGRLTLSRLNDEPIVGYSLSGNVGSLAQYPCVLFGVQVDGDLGVRMQDRWLTEATIRACAVAEDCPIMVNPDYLAYLLAGAPSRLARLPLSTGVKVRSTPVGDLVRSGEPARRRWSRVARENKDLVAAVLTVVAALLTLVLAF